jgi:hypothetical protein
VITTENTIPIANAGPDQTAYVSDVVTLDGSASSDADGNSLTYLWSITSAPPGSAATLSDPAAVYPTFTIDLFGDYQISLTVNDGFDNSIPDTVLVTTLNSVPVADAGPDQSGFMNDIVTLDGSGSHDADGDELTYSWSLSTRPAGSNAVLSNSNIVNPSFTIDVNGIYVAQLVVNDGTANSLADTVVITTDNTPPVANAGTNQTAFVGDTVTLDGSGSSDLDGDSLTFHWSFMSRPVGSVATLSDDTAVMPAFEVDVYGTYVVQLIVNDGTVDSSPDSVTIDIMNTAPVANAGPDQTVVRYDTVYLNGADSYDADEDALTYQWSLISRPIDSAAILSDPTAVNPSFSVDLPGEYVVQLIVNDGTVNSTADQVIITTQNSRPVANAGADQTVYVGDPVILDGSASSDADEDPLTFQWSITSAPAGSASTLSSNAEELTSFIPDLAGTYVIQLIVNDGELSSDPDSAAISVLALPELSVNNTTITEGDSGSVDMVFTVTLSPAAEREVTVEYATADSTA